MIEIESIRIIGMLNIFNTSGKSIVYIIIINTNCIAIDNHKNNILVI